MASLEEKCFAVDEALKNLIECVINCKQFTKEAQDDMDAAYLKLRQRMTERDEA